MRRAALLLLLLLAPAPFLLAAESRFAGWDEKKVAGHEKAARNRIAAKLRRWQSARKGLVFQCASCQGGGRVRQRAGRRGYRIVSCPTCKGTGGCISRNKFLTVFWDLRSPHYRSSKDRMRAAEELYKKARADPKKAIDFLQQITKWRRKSIDVKGNFAVVTYTEKQEAVETAKTVEWIEVDGKWWLAHEDVDSGFARHFYPKPGEATPAQEPTPPTTKEPVTPRTDAPKKEPVTPRTDPAPKPAPKPTPKTKKPPEDPEKLFRTTAPKIVHVEENAWKVFGQITNLTKDRRFAYLIVTISLYEGDTLVDTTECNVGSVILKAGATATYSGFLYADKIPDYDRKVARVSKYEEME